MERERGGWEETRERGVYETGGEREREGGESAVGERCLWVEEEGESEVREMER